MRRTAGSKFALPGMRRRTSNSLPSSSRWGRHFAFLSRTWVFSFLFHLLRVSVDIIFKCTQDTVFKNHIFCDCCVNNPKQVKCFRNILTVYLFLFQSSPWIFLRSKRQKKKKKMKRNECPERLLVMGYQLWVKKAQQKVSLILSFDGNWYFDLIWFWSAVNVHFLPSLVQIIKSFRKPMVWSTLHDAMLCRKILVVDPITGTKTSSVARGT